ncbi:hypothetical protein D9756_010277 [Leucocoprinus leucothites]|uniref:F-box domain-containing protein n=1 Tax=Leucocoprinus leucothites TaxID=201217 RepID=A0A8H5FSU6_9AGAR|nr:hypothetical protein D9756_010277 [Leucoagaricus leucothites]
MSTIDALPTEILEKILIHLPRAPNETLVKRLGNLRLVSKRIDDIVSPLILPEYFIIVSKRPSLIRCDEICTALATGTPTIFRHLRVLRVNMFYVKDEDASRPWFFLLQLLLPLGQINIVKWTYDPIELRAYSASVISDFLLSLTSLQSLTELDVIVLTRKDPGLAFPLEPIPQLRTFRILWHCPYAPHPKILSQISCAVSCCNKLENFSFVVPSVNLCKFESTVTFAQLFEAASSLSTNMVLQALELHGVSITPGDIKVHLGHFRNLTKLCVVFDPSPSAAKNIGEVLQILRESNIFLKNVLIDKIHHPGTFSYLSSYSGIEQLSLQPGHPLDDSPQLMDELFTSVLPAHSKSLKWLRIGRQSPSGWTESFSMEQLATVTNCQLLEFVHCWISIKPDDITKDESEALVNDYNMPFPVSNLIDLARNGG